MLDRPGPFAEQSVGETTERWIAALNVALASGQASALSELFAHPKSELRSSRPHEGEG